LYGTNQNVVLRKFVGHGEIIMDENVKQVEDQLHEEQEYESSDPIQCLIHNDVKHA